MPTSKNDTEVFLQLSFSRTFVGIQWSSSSNANRHIADGCSAPESLSLPLTTFSSRFGRHPDRSVATFYTSDALNRLRTSVGADATYFTPRFLVANFTDEEIAMDRFLVISGRFWTRQLKGKCWENTRDTLSEIIDRLIGDAPHS